ncbi:hypothetical protein CPAR01_16322, partial [Colletotrichum paranaense]
PSLPLLLSRPHTLVLPSTFFLFRCVYPKAKRWDILPHSAVSIRSKSLFAPRKKPSLDRPSPAVVTFQLFSGECCTPLLFDTGPVAYLLLPYTLPNHRPIVSALNISSSWLLGLVATVSSTRSTVTWDLSSESGPVWVEGGLAE